MFHSRLNFDCVSSSFFIQKLQHQDRLLKEARLDSFLIKICKIKLKAFRFYHEINFYDIDNNLRDKFDKIHFKTLTNWNRDKKVF